MVIFPIIVQFTAYRPRSMHDVACEFACAVTMHSRTERERLKVSEHIQHQRIESGEQ